MVFADGPKKGDKIQLSLNPPPWIKTAYPEWAVYEHRDGEYRLMLEGDLARHWRNPIRPDFADPFRDRQR